MIDEALFYALLILVMGIACIFAFVLGILIGFDWSRDRHNRRYLLAFRDATRVRGHMTIKKLKEMLPYGSIIESIQPSPMNGRHISVVTYSYRGKVRKMNIIFEEKKKDGQKELTESYKEDS